MPELDITTQDIDAYLATKQDDEEIGITCKARKCLLARVFQWKYPGHDIGIAVQSVVIDGEWYDLSDEMHMLYWDFDMLHKGLIERPVTKREWLAREATA